MLRDGGSVDDVGGGREEDRVPHDGRQQWVQELKGGLVGQVVNIFVAHAGSHGVLEQRREEEQLGHISGEQVSSQLRSGTSCSGSSANLLAVTTAFSRGTF
jgi:hypothetical protein